MSLGMPFGLGALPLEEFLRHAMYMILVNIKAIVAFGNVCFSK